MDSIFFKHPYKRLKPEVLPGIVAIRYQSQLIFMKNGINDVDIPYMFTYRHTENIEEEEMETILANHPEPIHTEVDPQLLARKVIQNSNIKAHCAQSAEILNDRLRHFLANYYKKNKITPPVDIYKTDFNGLRGILSPILKKDSIFHDIEIINTPEKRNQFTKIFSGFIEDRNIYAHGDLQIRTNDSALIIVYISKATSQEEFCEINDETFQSYFWIYQHLLQTISKMNDIVNKI